MSKKYSKDQIFEELVNILIDDFELKKESVTPNANLFSDLEFDSIDAVDLAVRLQQYTNKKILPDEFKKIKTVQDVVDAVYDLL